MRSSRAGVKSLGDKESRRLGAGQLVVVKQGRSAGPGRIRTTVTIPPCHRPRSSSCRAVLVLGYICGIFPLLPAAPLLLPEKQRDQEPLAPTRRWDWVCLHRVTRPARLYRARRSPHLTHILLTPALMMNSCEASQLRWARPGDVTVPLSQAVHRFTQLHHALKAAVVFQHVLTCAVCLQVARSKRCERRPTPTSRPRFEARSLFSW